MHDWTADDLDRIPGLPPHTELIDGDLVFASPQNNFHMFVLRKLEHGLYRCVPHEYSVVREMTVTLSPRQRPEPDLMVVRETGAPDTEQSSYNPADVELAVEVESPESKLRDRRKKPQLYAEVGIPHFWRVENQSGAAVVFVYEFDAKAKAYRLTGEHRGQLKVTEPFPIEIDLTELHRL